MKNKLKQILKNKAFRTAAKTFIIWLVIFSLFIFLFIKFVYYIKENITGTSTAKEKTKGQIDADNIRIKEAKEMAGNVSIT